MTHVLRAEGSSPSLDINSMIKEVLNEVDKKRREALKKFKKNNGDDAVNENLNEFINHVRNMTELETLKSCRKLIEEKIDKKIKYWENFIKEADYKKGSIRFVRIMFIIRDLELLKKELIGE